MMTRAFTISVVFAVVALSWCQAKDYVVSAQKGDDANPGTPEKPFRTLQKAADTMTAGDTCTVHGGTYRKTVSVRRSGEADRPIRFTAAPDETVLIDGTEPVPGPWELVGNSIYKTSIQAPVEQLFVDRKMMMEARWPNCRLEDIWVRDNWAHAASGSRKDLMISKDLPASGIDWTGAVAVLNIGPQYCSFARVVTKHEEGADRFEYELKQRMHDGKDDGPGWANDRFYLFGKLEALDAPGEWFYDTASQQLYLRCEDDRSPADHTVEYKARDLGFDLRRCRHVEIRGFHFFGTTFTLTDCYHCLVEDCRLLFPTFSRMLDDLGPKGARHAIPTTSVRGDDNTLRKISVGFSDTRGILVRGRRNLIENCVVHDVNWSGAFSYAGICLAGRSNTKAEGKDAPEDNLNTVRHCTVYGVGNVGIHYSRQKNFIEYNHVYDTGRACQDIAAIQTGSPRTFGSVAHHNWVHDSTGLGMRGDDQTRGLSFHHNVIWNCHRGFILKGNHNTCYNNTVLVDPSSPMATGSIVIAKRPEPKKWWTAWETLDVQNVDTLVCNNASYLVGSRAGALPETDKVFANVTLPKDLSTVFISASPEALRNGTFDLRPKPGSPLTDAGSIVPNITDTFVGTAPDVGAYETGGENWRAGADWEPDPVPWTMQIKLEPGRIGDFDLPSRIREAGISASGLRKLALLQHELWETDERIAERRRLIAKRDKVDRASEEWRDITKEIGVLHGQVYAGLKAKGTDLLEGKDRLAFEYAMDLKVAPAENRPTLRSGRPGREIRIDGQLDSAEWGPAVTEDTPRPNANSVRIGAETDPYAGQAVVLADKTHLYIAFRSRLGAGSKVRVGKNWSTDDAVEIALATATTALGSIKVLRGFASGHMESSREAGASEAVAKQACTGVVYAAKVISDTVWTAEWSIPFASLGVEPGNADKQILLNLSIHRTTPADWLMWCPTHGPTWRVQSAGRLLLPEGGI